LVIRDKTDQKDNAEDYPAVAYAVLGNQASSGAVAYA